MKILFVCYANMCRSPMAEALYRVNSAKEGRTDDVRSAGTHAYDGAGATGEAVQAVKKYGIELRHRAEVLDEWHMKWADLVLVTDKERKDDVVGYFPWAWGRVKTIGEYLDRSDVEIKDPVYDGNYEGCAALIDDLTRKVAQKLNAEE